MVRRNVISINLESKETDFGWETIKENKTGKTERKIISRFTRYVATLECGHKTEYDIRYVNGEFKKSKQCHNCDSLEVRIG